MTPQQIVIVQGDDLLDAVRRLDQELSDVVDQLKAMNQKMAAENLQLAQRLGIKREVQHGQ